MKSVSGLKNGKSNKKRKFEEHAPITTTEPTPPKQRMVVTPWTDTAEFKMVYNWLFDKDTTPVNLRKALSQLRIWSLRRGTLCPASVLATSVLIKAQLEDKQGNSNIQTTYASAFTRFFNFMSSIMQDYNMSSMYETARKLGLQSFIVDLRHLCAHGQELPPAVVLRHTAEHCTEWMRKFYWLPQREKMANLDAQNLQRKDKLKFERELSVLFELYDLALECQLEGAYKLKAINKLKSSMEFNKLRVYSSTKKAKTTMEMLNAVVNDLAAAIKRQPMEELLDIYMSSVLNMKYFLVAGLKHTEQEELLIEATQELFRLFAVQGYIENLFVAFVQLTENENVSNERRAGASYWGSKMLQTFVMLSRMKRMYQEELDMNPDFKPIDFSMLNKPVVSKLLRQLLIHSGVDQSLTLIFCETSKKPRSWVFDEEFLIQRQNNLNTYSATILKGLLPLMDSPLTAEQIENLTELCNIYEARSRKQSEEAPTITNIAQSATFGIWKLETDYDWSKCALGVLPEEISLV
ncbi:uncharacterized protein LOC108598914 [Drosophila busckii]|nr:uncharacterized protein LOC108598914 [Drosophila busckii]